MKAAIFKIRPVEAISQGRWHSLSSWLRNSLYGLVLGLCGAVMFTSCKTIYVPVGTDSSTNVKDSTVLHIVDSVRYTERSRYKDYGDLLNVLEIEGKHSRMRSWIDTTKNVLNGELTEDPIEEKTRTVVKTQYRDSIQYVEKKVPYPVEVVKEKKIYPKWMIVLSLLGVLNTCLLGFIGYLKIKKKTLKV